MDSLRNLYKIGNGPSSSHTMGPQYAAEIFKKKHPDAQKYTVELFGSLALTGKGHLTDYIIKQTLGVDKTEVIFNYEQIYNYHTNAMKFKAYINDVQVDKWLVFSVGGGSLKELDEARDISNDDIYPCKTMKEVLAFLKEKNISIPEYVDIYDKNIDEYLQTILLSMESTIQKGLYTIGTLPGRLQIKRRANNFYAKYKETNSKQAKIYAYALATGEENASGGIVVTSPTCGASGVLPAVLLSYEDIPRHQLINALKVAGLIGNLIKFNGSISGAEVGCQGEIGAACSMAAAASCYLQGGNNNQIEYASEIALEHHLGLTCDPVDGVVQIPCIERNALASTKAIDSAMYAMLTDGNHLVSLDDVIDVMHQTGIDLNNNYKETSIGGLAKKTL